MSEFDKTISELHLSEEYDVLPFEELLSAALDDDERDRLEEFDTRTCAEYFLALDKEYVAYLKENGDYVAWKPAGSYYHLEFRRGRRLYTHHVHVALKSHIGSLDVTTNDGLALALTLIQSSLAEQFGFRLAVKSIC